MGTRSTISILRPNGTIESVWCKFDGGLQANGLTLWAYYQDAEKINALINLGDLCSLDKELGPPIGQPHSVIKKVDGYCTFFNRDGSPQDKSAVFKPVIYKNFEEYSHALLEHNDYVFKEKNSTWYRLDNESFKLLPLKTALKKAPWVGHYRQSLFFQTLEKEQIILDKEKITQAIIAPSVSSQLINKLTIKI